MWRIVVLTYNSEESEPDGQTRNGADEEKKARIIAAAVSEFAIRGYKNANTNRIVKEAGVSKGLLFHYFGSKKDLYIYLFDYAMRVISDDIFAGFDWSERDIFKLWGAAAAMKFDTMRKYGMLFEFLLDAYARPDDEIRHDIDVSVMFRLSAYWRDMTEHVDLSLFRDDIDAKKAVEIIYWTIEGYSKRWVSDGPPLAYYEEHYDDMVSELDVYLDMLRRLLYK
jgi:AcrR family transcriptional regulator